MRLSLLYLLGSACILPAFSAHAQTCPDGLGSCNLTGSLTIAGRATIGNGAVTNGSLTTGAASVTPNYVSQSPVEGWLDFHGYGSTSMLRSYSSNGQVGILGASQASDASSGSSTSIGVAAFAHSNNTLSNPGSWGFYGTVLRDSNSMGSLLGEELEIANEGPTVISTPYNISGTGSPNRDGTTTVNGVTAGLWLGSGGESATPSNNGTGPAVHPASVAIALHNNGCGSNPNSGDCSFNKGIVFGIGALTHPLTTAPSASSVASAIEMPSGSYGAQIDWTYDASDTKGFFIRSDYMGANGPALGIRATANNTLDVITYPAGATGQGTPTMLTSTDHSGNLTIAGGLTAAGGFTTAGTITTTGGLTGLAFSSAMPKPFFVNCAAGAVLDSHATHNSGMVTVGSATNGCEIHFTDQFSWNHCRVTSQTPISDLSYAYNYGAIYLSSSSGKLAGNKFDYECDGQ